LFISESYIDYKMSILSKLQEEYKELKEKLSSPEKITDWDFVGERKKFLDEIVPLIEGLEDVKKRIEENKKILEEQKEEDLVEIAKEEETDLKKEKDRLTKEIKELIAENQNEGELEVKKDTAIVEIRAGAGGDEASIFVKNLFEMYSRFGELKGMNIIVLDDSKTEQNGYKSITFKLKGRNPYFLLRFEAGVHRVQRVPETEKSGRVHTSTVSVAVLPEPKKGKVKINPADIKLETCKSSGPGGQYVNKRETAVRIVHEPSGIVVTSQNERSLQQNKETALSVLEAKLLEKEQRERIEKLEKERKEQIGTAMRAEKIRTYNYMQNRVTDHRIDQSWYKLEEILNGDLDEIIDALREAEEREKYKDIVID